ncbi:hypothetical protein ACFYYH_31025 [Streptomyces sp. NPDC002018]|uniref:hypothetical protein n=1 Tax=Streptomyces sp. NPDC002018 TaxID=3364629 RepID=UPI0036AB8BF3
MRVPKRLLTAALVTTASLTLPISTSAAQGPVAETVSAPRAAAPCGGVASSPIFGVWGPAGRSSCSFLGSSASTKLTYTVWIPPGTQQSATVQVWGYTNGVGNWFSAGNIKSSTANTRVAVPWGNNAATPRIQVMSTNVGMANVSFSH